MEITLVLEELFTNVVFYAFDDKEVHNIHVEFRLMDANTLQLRLEDDGKPFNLLEKQMGDLLEKPVEEREIGGLGIHFVRKMMKSVEYERSGNHNVVVLTKDF
jgi:anti-sigma regulatory factor (Ser/Thr protein kinase)